MLKLNTEAMRLDVARTTLLGLTAAWIATVPNLAALKQFALAPAAASGVGVIPFVVGGWLAIFAVTLLLLTLFGSVLLGSRIRLLCAVATVSAAILGYYSLALGMRFDRAMFASLVLTDVAEVRDLITPNLVIWTLLVGVLPASLMLCVRVKPQTWRYATVSATVWLVAAFALVFATILPQYQRYASAGRTKAITFHTIAPANFVGAAVSLGLELRRVSLVRGPLGLDARASYPLEKPRIVVFVLGETARAANHALNGYPRPTNPRLQAEDIVYFADSPSCGTITAISVPCMFSGLTRQEFSLSKALQRETLVDVVKHSNVVTMWRENDGGCKDVCRASVFEDFTNADHPTLCTERGNCHDEILLLGLEAKLRATTSDTFVVLHLKGSHGPAYYKRYPDRFEHFKPACKSTEFSQCTTEEIVNAYDNTIRYTDHVIAETIGILKRLESTHAPVLLYASDHGESLGEGGIYLHGLPYAVAPDTQTRVPILTWLSQSFLRHEGWKENCHALIARQKVSHDNMFHSILVLLDIDTNERNPNLDLYAACDADDDNDSHRKK